MRILHLDPDDVDSPLSGGGPVRTLEIYKRLARRHEITVLTPTFPGSTPELVRDGIRYIRLGRKIRNHGSSHHVTFLASLPKAVRSFDHELLVEDTMPPASATWTPLFHTRSKPLIASVQWWSAHEYTRWLKLPFHLGQTHGIRMYRHFVTLTKQMSSTIHASHPRADCRVIPNGVDGGLFLVEPHAGRSVLYLGRIDVKGKGLDLLLRAMKSMPEHLRIRLVIAGQGQDQHILDRLLDELALRPWVRLVGKVGPAERARLLHECRFLVMPSHYETFGMTIAEANAAGKLSVVFDAWPMNEVAAPPCPRVVPQDVRGLADAMQKLMDLPDETLLSMGAECREWARQYNWDTVAQEQEAYYEDVMQQHQARRGRPMQTEARP